MNWINTFFIIKELKKYKRLIHRKKEGLDIIKRNYFKIHGRELNTENPVTFTEKLFNRMLYLNQHGSPIITQLSDKYLARSFVSKRIGDKYLIRLIWNGKDPNKIPFNQLPDNYIIKTNHGSGGNIIANINTDKTKLIKTVSNWLEENYYWVDREYQYYDIKPMLLIEELLIDDTPFGLLDYKIWCFDGKAKLIQIIDSKKTINVFYDITWEKLDINYGNNINCHKIAKPENLQEMIIVAEKLSTGFDFVRVDLYNTKNKIFFGELTFTPRAGRFKFDPDYWDFKLGELWQLRNDI